MCSRRSAARGRPWGHGVLAQCNRRGEGDCHEGMRAALHATRSADAGNVHGLADWALCLQNGVGTTTDEARAVRLTRQSAEAGCLWGVMSWALGLACPRTSARGAPACGPRIRAWAAHPAGTWHRVVAWRGTRWRRGGTTNWPSSKDWRTRSTPGAAACATGRGSPRGGGRQSARLSSLTFREFSVGSTNSEASLCLGGMGIGNRARFERV
jgi:hypothetical protein